MADYKLVLKCWGPQTEADYLEYGAVIMTRFLILYPENRRFMYRIGQIPVSELADSAVIAEVGAIKLKAVYDMIKLRGNYQNLMKPWTVRHISRNVPMTSFKYIHEVIADVMGEKRCLDNAEVKALKRAMAEIFVTCTATYKEHGAECLPN